MNDVGGKKRKETVDAVAATVILEDYLRSIKK
jgi:RNase H-fold protein (predicted Holliday junction resolvase)